MPATMGKVPSVDTLKNLQPVNLNNIVEVRFVDQKPTLNKVWGIGPEFKSAKALGLENLMPVSV